MPGLRWASPAGRIAAKYREWAQLLVRDGFVVLFPESYGSRGLGNQCSVRNRAVRPEHELVDDANASRRWLSQRRNFSQYGHHSVV